MGTSRERQDRLLGLDNRISRRDFLNGALLSASALWAADLAPSRLMPSQNGRQTRWGGNTEDAVTAGHAIRDHKYDKPDLPSVNTGELYDLVVVGGGFSGLAAAYYFSRKGRGKALVLENHPVIGGNARRDEFQVGGQVLYAPQGSIVGQDLPPSFAAQPPVDKIFDELGVDLAAARVPKEQSDFGVFWDRGTQPHWYANLFEAPIGDAVKKDFMAFFETIMPFYQDANWTKRVSDLDRYTFKDFVEKERKWNPEVYNLFAPDLAAFFGFPDQVSAGMVYAQYGGGPRQLYAFPGGNSALLRRLLKKVSPASISGGDSPEQILRGRFVPEAMDKSSANVRIRLESTAVSVKQEGSNVKVVYSKGGKLYQVRARGVVMAGGGYVTKHIVSELPKEQYEAFNRFQYAPVLWINVALNNSRAIDNSNISFLSTYHDGFGVMLVAYERMSASQAPKRDSSRPNVIGIGAPRFLPGLPPGEQATKGRTEMLSTPFRDYERKAREDLVRLLGPWGFDPKKDIEAISISRWGHHGYIFPYAGIFTDGSVEIAKRPFGRIAFAHTDLDRFSHMVGALRHGQRAAQEIMDKA